MKNVWFALVMSLVSFNAFALAPAYECEGFAGVDEYRAGIDLVKKKAGFFDNDSTSVMKLTSTKTQNGQTVFTFEGPDASYSGKVRLTFNVTKLNASVHSIAKGKTSLIGKTSSCKAGKPWDLEN